MQRAFTSAKCTRTPAVQTRMVHMRAAMQRRDVFVTGMGLALATTAAPDSAIAAEKIDLPINQLSTFDRSDQRKEVLTRSKEELRKVLTKDDAPKALRLVLNEAATYDRATKTGGFDGSIVLAKEETSRPENAGLDDYISRLGKAKKAIDEGNAALGSGPISWADLIVVAAKYAVQEEWKDIKIKRSASREGGEQIVKSFGAAWDVRLGRVDSAEAAPAGRVPALGSSPEQVMEVMLKLGAKPGDGGAFAPKPPFWERPTFVLYTASRDDPKAAEDTFAASSSVFADLKSSYDRERRTITRTNYEVDFINYFTNLTNLGAKFDPDAYLHSVKVSKLQ